LPVSHPQILKTHIFLKEKAGGLKPPASQYFNAIFAYLSVKVNPTMFVAALQATVAIDGVMTATWAVPGAGNVVACPAVTGALAFVD